jgi:hypothetical protein
LIFVDESHKLIDFSAVSESDDRRDRSDFGGQAREVVYVDDGQMNFAWKVI